MAATFTLGRYCTIMTNSEKRSVHVQLDVPFYVRLKRRAIAEERTMSGIIRRALEKYMEDSDGR